MAGALVEHAFHAWSEVPEESDRSAGPGRSAFRGTLARLNARVEEEVSRIQDALRPVTQSRRGASIGFSGRIRGVARAGLVV